MNIDLMQRIALLTGRGLLGLYFIVPGLSKVFGWAGTVEAMTAKGVPLVPVALVITIVIQVGAGASLLLGFKAQVMAALLAGLTILINVFMHDFWNDAGEMQNFIKNLAIMAGLLFVSGANLQEREKANPEQD